MGWGEGGVDIGVGVGEALRERVLRNQLREFPELRDSCANRVRLKNTTVGTHGR